MEADYILDKRECFLHNSTIGKVKVHWKHLSLDEVTWELESDMWVACLDMFQEDLE